MENLQTKRLLIKPLTVEDTREIFELNKDPEVIKYTGDVSFAHILEARYGVFLTENNIFRLV